MFQAQKGKIRMNTFLFRGKKTLVSIMATVILLVAVPLPASAISIHIINEESRSMSVALLYYEDANVRWVCSGWYNFDPKERGVINLPESTEGGTLYFYGESNRGCMDGSNRDDSKDYTVVSDSFKYDVAIERPSGHNRKKVNFIRIPITSKDMTVVYQENH